MDPLAPVNYAHLPVPMTGQDVPSFWLIPSMPLVFAPGTGNILRQARWQSPILDLYPWFKGAMGEYPLNVQPVWREPLGAGGQLFLWIRGFETQADSKTGLRIVTREAAHPADTTLVQPYLEQEDHSLSVGATAPAFLVNLQPPGGGYPIRYWQVTLLVQYTEDHPDPDLWVEGAYY